MSSSTNVVHYPQKTVPSQKENLSNLIDFRNSLRDYPENDETSFERVQTFHDKGLVNKKVLNLVSVGIRNYSLTKNKYLFMLSKRVFDLFSSLFLLFALSPLLILVSILIKANSTGPVFFRQRRVGHHYQIFSIFKFRTMVDNAEKLYQENDTPLEKKISDSRTTSLGAFLRKWKIDELPQLINVLKGEMSLVGPRPFSIEDSACCPPSAIDRHSVKPGLTGFWQANFDNTISYKYKFKLDSIYSRKCSWKMDLEILAKTPFRVLQGEKAMASHRVFFLAKDKGKINKIKIRKA